MIRSWRLSAAKWVGQFFSGKGALIHGGRWNSPGRPVIYVSDSLALCVLENLVHMRKMHFMQDYKAIPVDIPDLFVTDVPLSSLPPNWKDSSGLASTQAIGDNWFDQAATPALRVPSMIIDIQSNYLINPTHNSFSGIAIGSVKDFEFDPRLFEF